MRLDLGSMVISRTTVGQWPVLCPKEEIGVGDIKDPLLFLQVYFLVLHKQLLAQALPLALVLALMPSPVLVRCTETLHSLNSQGSCTGSLMSLVCFRLLIQSGPEVCTF